jgi:hypothetical protein
MTQQAVSLMPPPAVRLSCDLPGFLADWHRCDQFSNYLAEAVSLNKADPFAFSSMLSTMINEVLETIYYHNAGEGALTLHVTEEADAATVLRAEFAVDASSRALYERIVATLEHGDPVGLYEKLLFQASTGDARDICLYEIAADYGARLALEQGSRTGVIALVVRMELNAWLDERAGRS